MSQRSLVLLTVLTLILFQLVWANDSAVFGSEDPDEGIYPINCFECAKEYPGFYFCRVENSFGACCHHGSTSEYFETNAELEVECSNEEPNEDFFFEYCIERDSKQCNGSELILIESEV